MFINFLRNNKVVAYLFVVLRVYVGWEWLTSGWGKITNGFDAGGFLQNAINSTSGEHATVQGFWGDVLHHFALPNVDFFNALIPWGELLVGLGLIFGCLTTFAALMGAVMNFAYLFSGTVSTNPYLLLLEMLILVAGLNAGRIGLDYWLKPTFNRMHLLMNHLHFGKHHVKRRHA